MAALSW